MPQKRFYNYDSNADSVSENMISYGLHPKGVYRGLDLVITTDNKLTVATGYGLQHNGVMWVEDTAVELGFTPPAVATQYTVAAYHDNRLIFGGTRVYYEVTPSIISDVSGGVVLGWIYHPGGGMPLIQDYVVSAPKQLGGTYANLLATTQPTELLPAYPGSIVTSVGPDLTVVPSAFDVGTFTLYQGVSSSPTAVGVQQVVQQLQLYVNNSLRPNVLKFYFFCSAPAVTNLVVEVYGTDLLPVPLTGATLTGSGVWEYKAVYVDTISGTFDDGLPYTVRLTYNVDKGKEIRVGRIVVGYWPYPSTP